MRAGEQSEREGDDLMSERAGAVRPHRSVRVTAVNGLAVTRGADVA